MIPALAGALGMLFEAVGAAGVGGAAAGGTAAAGSAASAGGAATGLAGMLGRFGIGSGAATAFGSTAELGGALQRVEDIASLVSGLNDAQKTISAQQTATAAQFRDEEANYLYGNPAHQTTLADLERQRVANEQQRAAMQQESSRLEQRIRLTNGTEPSGWSGRQLGTMASAGAGMFAAYGLGGGGADPGLAGQIAAATSQARTPGLLGGITRMMPWFQATQNMQQAALQPMTDLGVGKTEGAIMGGAASFSGRMSEITSNPLAMLRGEHIAHMAKLPGLIRDWGQALVDSKKELAQFNGAYAMIFAEEERRGILRNVESGQRTGGAMTGLSESLQELYDLVQPMKDTVTVVLATGLELLVRGTTQIVKTSHQIYTALKYISKTVGALDAINEAIQKWFGRNAAVGDIPIVKFMQDAHDRDLRPRRPPRRP